LSSETSRAAWLARGDAEAVLADALLLAVCAFPGLPEQAAWVQVLLHRLGECSAELLPSLLLSSAATTSSPRPLLEATEDALVAELEAGAAARLPLATVIAAARGLARSPRVAERSAWQAARLRPALQHLVGRVVTLLEAGEVRVKSVVRMLQVLHTLRVAAPPDLLRGLAAREAGVLAPGELLVALRLLTPKGVEAANLAGPLGALATRTMLQFKSSRQAWELEGLCKKLGLELGEVDAPIGSGEALDQRGQEQEPTKTTPPKASKTQPRAENVMLEVPVMRGQEASVRQ